MSGICYDNFTEINQTGDLLLYCDQCSRTNQLLYQIVLMIVKDPVYLESSLTGDYVVTSTSNPIRGFYGCRLVRLSTVVSYLRGLGGTLYYRQLRCNRDNSWESLLVTVMTSVIYFPREQMNEVEWVTKQFYHPSGIYTTSPKLANEPAHLIAYIYIRLGILPTGIPWEVLSSREFSYDYGFQLPFTGVELLPERYLDFT